MKNQQKHICNCDCKKEILNPITFNGILKFWKKRQWHYEISTNFNIELYFRYLNAINNDV